MIVYNSPGYYTCLPWQQKYYDVAVQCLLVLLFAYL